MCDCNEVSECDISFSSLDRSYERPMEVSSVRKRFLSVPPCDAPVPYHPAQSNQEFTRPIFCVHTRQCTGR